MKCTATWLLALAVLPTLVGGGTACAAPRTHISVPAQSLIRVDHLTGWTLEVGTRYVARDVTWHTTAFELDGWHGFVGLAFSPHSSVRLGGFVGATTLDVQALEGDYGPLWGLNASLAMMDYVLEDSPVYGPKKSIRFMADVEILHASPSIDGDDGTMEQVTVSPHVVYARNLQGADRWHPYTLLGVALRGGLVFSSIEVEVGDETYEELNDYGVLLGADMQFNEQIGLKVTSHLFADDDQSFEIRLGYYF